MTLTIPTAEASNGLDALFSELYQELRRIAHLHRFRLGRNQTLCTTAIVNETYLRLKNAGHLSPRDRLHFLALSARTMRFLLVDYARRWRADKRRRDETAGPGEGHDHVARAHADSTLALHEALDRLSGFDDRIGRVVEYRFFGGMTEAEVAEVLGVSERTVRGDWQRARLWLARDLGALPAPAAGAE